MNGCCSSFCLDVGAGNTSLKILQGLVCNNSFVDCRFPSTQYPPTPPRLITNHRYVTPRYPLRHNHVTRREDESQPHTWSTCQPELRISVTVLAENYQFVIQNAVTGSQNKSRKSIPVFNNVGIFCSDQMIDHFDMTIKAPDINTNRLLSN